MTQRRPRWVQTVIVMFVALLVLVGLIAVQIGRTRARQMPHYTAEPTDQRR